jgi:chromosome segregation ATPase
VSDLPATAPALTSDEIRRIISQELPGAIRAALSDYPTMATVQTMIEAAVRPIRESYERDIKSIDLHLREAEGKLSSATRKLEVAADRFSEVARDTAESLGELKTANTERQRQVTSLEHRLSNQGTQITSDRGELTKVINTVDDLHKDIHGDPSEPHTVSLFQMLKQRQDEANTQYQTILQRFDGFEPRLKAAEGYIASRLAIETALLQWTKGVLQNKWIMAALIVAGGSFLGMRVFEQFIEVLLK